MASFGIFGLFPVFSPFSILAFYSFYLFPFFLYISLYFLLPSLGLNFPEASAYITLPVTTTTITIIVPFTPLLLHRTSLLFPSLKINLPKLSVGFPSPSPGFTLDSNPLSEILSGLYSEVTRLLPFILLMLFLARFLSHSLSSAFVLPEARTVQLFYTEYQFWLYRAEFHIHFELFRRAGQWTTGGTITYEWRPVDDLISTDSDLGDTDYQQIENWHFRRRSDAQELILSIPGCICPTYYSTTRRKSVSGSYSCDSEWK